MKRSLTILAFLLPLLSARAQTGMRDAYSYTLANTPWLTSRNAAGIWSLPSDKMSKVQAGFRKEGGGLTDLHQSDDCYEAEVAAESFMKVSEHLAFYGHLGYSSFSGRNMGGPMLMDPYYNPVNFLESTGTTTGIKSKEMYNLQGGLAWKFNPRLEAGGRIGYRTGNYAKRKDPRPESDWMELETAVGARYSFPSARIGLNARYKRTVETLEARIFGTKDRRYYYLIDYGGFFGKVEELEGDYGYVATYSQRPMFNQFVGGAAQIETDLQRFKVYFEAGWMYRSGYYGKKASESVQYYTLDGYSLDGRLRVSYDGPRVRHVLDMQAESDETAGRENSFNYSTTPGSGTVIQYFGSQKAGDNRVTRGQIGYRAEIDPAYGKLPKWMAGAGAEVFGVDRTGILYPFYRSQRLFREHFYLTGQRYLEWGRNAFSFSLVLSFLTGVEPEFAEGLLAQASGNPRSNAVYAGRNREYFTTPAYGGTFSFRWSGAFNDKLQGYFDIGDRYLFTNQDLTFLTGRDRNVFAISVGCVF